MVNFLYTVASYMPIVIGIAWWLLMKYQGYEGAINKAKFLILGCLALAVWGRSIGTVSQNLPMLMTLLILAYVNIVLFPKLRPDNQKSFSQGNGLASLALLVYQVWFQFGNIWHPYLAIESFFMTILLVIYIFSASLFLLFSLYACLSTGNIRTIFISD